MYPFPEPRFIVEAQIRRMGQTAGGGGSCSGVVLVIKAIVVPLCACVD